MEDKTESTSQSTNAIQQNLPNHILVLVLGICSIVFCWCYGIFGIIPGIIALVLASKSKKLYSADPQKYTESSFKNVKTGRICALIGTILSGLYLAWTIFYIVVYGAAVMSEMPWDQF